MTTFQVGDKIVIATDLADPSTLREYTISKLSRHGLEDTVQCGSSENTFYVAFCWPIAAKPQLIAILQERQKLKAAFDNSMKLIYELQNAIARGEVTR